MTPALEETIYCDFITSSSTGAAADADSTPTAEVFEDNNDTAILSPTVTKRTSKTGNYRVPVACTAANGFEVGKSYNVVASATVGGVAAKAVVKTFQVRAANIPVDVQTIKTQAVTCSAGVTVAPFVGNSTAAIGVNASGHVSRVVLTDTATTLTNAPSDSPGVTTLLLRIPAVLRLRDIFRAITGFRNFLSVDKVNGNDLTGTANSFDTPYATITEAAADAGYGDLVYVLPGASGTGSDRYLESNIEISSGLAVWLGHGTIVAPQDTTAAFYADGDGALLFGSGMIDAYTNGVGFSANDAVSSVHGITIRATASGSKAVSQSGAGCVVLRDVNINGFVGTTGVTDPQDLFQADNSEYEKIMLDNVGISYNADAANATGIFVFGGNPNTFDLSNGVGTTVLNDSSVTDIREELDANSTKLANLDATVSSRLPTSSYTAPDNSGISTAATQATAAATSAATAATQSTSAATNAAAIAAKLPSKSKLAGTDNSDGDIQLNEATGAFTEAALENTPSSSGGTVGAGADEVTLTITSNGDPVADADVWISSDSAGAHVVAGTLQTNSSGQVTFLLDAGVTYYLWMQKDGQNPIRGQSFVAVAD